MIFTVWVAFQLNDSANASTDWLRFFYAITWAISASSALGATILSVLLILAVNETGSDMEAKHFIDLFDDSTAHLGIN